MAWVSRDQNRAINGVFANQQSGIADENLADTDTSVIAFLNQPAMDPIDRWDVLSLKISFNHENRIRALELKQPITVAQFKAALRAL